MPLIDHKTWKEGDFEVITSDCVRFLIPSDASLPQGMQPALQHLLTHSSLCRDAQTFVSGKDGDPKYSITLVDDEFETASIFETIMDMITTGELTLPDRYYSPASEDSSRSFRLYRNLSQFAVKWGCEAVLGTIHQSVYRVARDMNGGSLLAFAIGALGDNRGVCRSATMYYDQRYSPRSSPLKDVHVFDPRFWPSWCWDECPGLYLGALVQAWMTKDGPNVDFPAIFDFYLDHLKKNA